MSQKSYLPSSNNSVGISTMATIEELKANDSDFEWYPTTDEMIEAVITDISAASRLSECHSVLEVGAGDARVLNEISKHKNIGCTNFYAIEKAPEHVARWHDRITFVGGNFYESNIANKSVDIIFSNPPFGEYERWTEHLIKNAHTKVIYLVLPERWVNSDRIQAAIKFRGMVSKVILSGDFLNADRRARAKVNVLRITSDKFSDEEVMTILHSKWTKGSYSFSNSDMEDPMSLMFAELFPNISNINTTHGDYTKQSNEQSYRHNELFKAANTIEGLVTLYEKECSNILENYKTLDSLDKRLFNELKLNLDSIKKMLTERMTSLRNEFWQVFIRHYKPIADRLTVRFRKRLYDEVINKSKDIEFNVINAIIVTEIVLRAANDYKDEQVKMFFLDLSSEKGIKNYKSNEKVFSEGEWRYAKYTSKEILGQYALDYRIVQQNAFRVDYGWKGDISAYNLKPVIEDLYVIARLVGMRVPQSVYLDKMSYDDYFVGESIYANYVENEKTVELFKIKFFKNGNQHLFLNQEFALRLNIYVGKLLGWLKNSKQAYEEMGEVIGKANETEFSGIFEDVNTDHIALAGSGISLFLENKSQNTDVQTDIDANNIISKVA